MRYLLALNLDLTIGDLNRLPTSQECQVIRPVALLLALVAIITLVSCTSDSNSFANDGQRETMAISSIKEAYGKTGYEYSVTLFVNHHLAELKSDYWQELLGTTEPSPSQVLSALILKKKWKSDGSEIYDFTLPNHVTDYVICVEFNSKGEIVQITMES